MNHWAILSGINCFVHQLQFQRIIVRYKKRNQKSDLSQNQASLSKNVMRAKLIIDTKLLEERLVVPLKKEANELTSVFIQSRKTAQKKKSGEK